MIWANVSSRENPAVQNTWPPLPPDYDEIDLIVCMAVWRFPCPQSIYSRLFEASVGDNHVMNDWIHALLILSIPWASSVLTLSSLFSDIFHTSLKSPCKLVQKKLSSTLASHFVIPWCAPMGDSCANFITGSLNFRDTTTCSHILLWNSFLPLCFLNMIPFLLK